MQHYDVIVIGAGTAGLGAVKMLLKNRANYLLVEQGEGGTMCAKTGCMPSKSLIEVSNAFAARKQFPEFGIEGSQSLQANIPKVLRHVRDLRDFFVDDVLEDMKRLNVAYGKARFTDVNTIQVNGESFSGDAIILATGSHPRIPKPFDQIKSEVLTTDSFFEQADLPDTMAVIGLGSVGLELGQALARLGIKVEGIEPTHTLAAIEDDDIRETAKKLMGQEMSLSFDTLIDKVEKVNSTYRLHAGNKTFDVGGILVSAGRAPNLQNLGLEDINAPMDAKGIPAFDSATMQIKGMPIYIVGDVNTHLPLQHVAAHEGRRAALKALGKSTRGPHPVPLAITFTDPPIASVGEKRDSLDINTLIVGTASYEAQNRARMSGKNKGLAKIYAKSDGRLVRAELMIPGGDHMSHLLALAIQENLTAKDILEAPFYHPMLEEGLRSALGEIIKNQKEST